MAREGGRILGKLRQMLWRASSRDLPDAQLLDRFLAGGDEAAFAALVDRHGPMVLGVCQRVLGNSDDAADAFQSVFLVLARRASAIRKRAALPSWLYGVAYRVAKKMSSTAALRRRRERQAAAAVAQAPSDRCWEELLAGLDEELQALAEKYRQPLVLCFLEGLSQEEAAAHLGWPRGTLKRRLERGRELLRQRLTRRGLTLGATAIGTLSAARVLATPLAVNIARLLAVAAVQFALRKPLPPGLVTPAAVTVAEGVLNTMLLARLKLSAVVLMIALLPVGAWVYAHSNSDSNPDSGPTTAPLPLSGPKKPAVSDEAPARAPRPITAAKVRDTFKDDDYVRSLVFSPDGKTLLAGTAASAGPPYGHIRPWDVVKRRKKTWEVSSQFGVEALAMSPKGKLIAMSTAGTRIGGFQVQPGELKLLDTATGTVKALLRSDAHSFLAIAFSPDGKTLAGGTPNWDARGQPVLGGVIRTWDVATRKPLRTLKGHRGMVRSVAFDRGGKLLASVSVERPPPGRGQPRGEVRLWDLSSGKEKARVNPSGRPFWCVAFSPDGNLLASAGEDRVVHLWDVTRGAEIATLEGHQGSIYALAFSPDGATLASGGGDLSNHPSPGEVRLWDVAGRKETALLKEHEVTVTALAFNYDGTRLASGSHDGAVIVWDMTRDR